MDLYLYLLSGRHLNHIHGVFFDIRVHRLNILIGRLHCTFGGA